MHTLLRPDRPIPAPIARLTGLRDADVAAAPRLAELAPALRETLADRTLIAHNAAFERHFLDRFELGCGTATRDLDTQDLLALTHPDAPDLRLATFTRQLLGVAEQHRALSDAIQTTQILSYIARRSLRGDPRYAAARNALERFAPQSRWRSLLDGAAPRATPVSRDFVPIGVGDGPREDPVPCDEAAIAAVLRDRERGRRHFGESYRVREAQVELAVAVLRALREGRVLVLEGGTGVGKSLAYLAASLPFALAGEDEKGREEGETGRRPIVLSTRTKLLQDQLLEKDIPAAARFLGYPDLRAISIKGRANYACARRLAATLAGGLEPRMFAQERMAFAVLESSAALRPHGEIASLPGAWTRRFPILAGLLRRAVSTRAEDCESAACATHRDCPLGRRRRALGAADLVVANHDLLLRWPADYPDFAYAIVDEAHELPPVADEIYALSVEPDLVLERFDAVFGRPPTGVSPGGASRGSPRRTARRDTVALRRALHGDLVALGRALGPLAGNFGEAHIPGLPAVERGPYPSLRTAAESAAERLESALALAERSAADAAPQRPLDDLRAAAATLRLAFGGEEATVTSFERVAAPWDRWRLSVRPVSPGPTFRDHFTAQLRSWVAVSASLLIGGSGRAALGELELDAEQRRRPRTVSIPSPFPYPELMRCVVLRETGDLVERTAAAVERIAVLLDGRTLALFTSLQRMREVADRIAFPLRERGIDVITPRRASDDPGALIERFRRGSAVLLGARKFWQGVDLPGDVLQAVVIEKLPFEVPTELRRRREDNLRQAGGDPFAELTVGKMLLNLKQMVGRLIRSEDDRGIVILVDAPAGRRYLARLDEALPPGCAPQRVGLDDLEDVLAEVGLPRP